MKRFGFLLLCFLSIWISVRAEFVLNNNVKQAYTNIYRLHLNAAEEIIAKEYQLNPDNDFIPYLRFNVAFTKVFLSEDRGLYLETEGVINRYINKIKVTNEESPWHATCLSEMYMMRSALKLKFGRNVKSGFDGLKAYNNAQEAFETYPDFKPSWLNWGLVNVAVGSVPDSYKGLIGALGFDGDIEEGLQFIEESWKYSQEPKNIWLSAKSTLIYGYVSMQLEEDNFGSLSELNLRSDFRKNNLLIYVEGKFLQEKRNNKGLIMLLEKRDKSEEVFPFHYLSYMEGKAKVAAMQEDADVPLLDYLENYQGENFIKSAHYNLAVHYYLRGQTNLAGVQKSLVDSNGMDQTGADKMALFMAARAFNRTLLLAQAHYDNGDYQKALTVLNSSTDYCKTRTDSVEMFYRLGRIYQALNNDFEAIASYKQAIEVAKDESTYFSASSAFQLASILNAKNMFASSRYYLKLTLEYNKYPFQDGLQQKAKALYKRIEKK